MQTEDFLTRSCSVQLIYSVYQRQNIHYIICPSHWAEGKGHSWQDYAQLKGLETVHCSSSGLQVDIPKVHWLVLPLGYTLCPATQNVTYTSRQYLYHSFAMKGFFFFNFQKPYTESMSLLPLSFHHVLFVASCYRVLSKGSPTLSYLSPAGGPGGEFLASCTLSVIHMNFRGGMYSA